MIGRVIGGKYKLLEPLGEGGMGAVYKAEEVGEAGYRKVVAVKSMLAPTGVPAHLVEAWTRKFKEEAVLMGLLNHSNIVHIITFLVEGGEYFIVMEFVDGTNVRKLVDYEGEVPANIVAYVAVEACKALGYIHAFKNPDGSKLHLLHRDVSPQNILVSKNGEVKMADLGVAKATNAKWRKQTIGNIFIGNPQYSSPEATAQDPDAVLDGRADLYSLGIVLYEVVTKTTPFSGNSLSVNIAQREVLSGQRRIPSILDFNPKANPALARVIEKAIALRREERFQSADEMMLAMSEGVPTYNRGFIELKQFLHDIEPEKAAKIVFAAAPEERTYREQGAQASTPRAEAAAPAVPIADQPTIPSPSGTGNASSAVPHFVHDDQPSPIQVAAPRSGRRSSSPSGVPIVIPRSEQTLPIRDHGSNRSTLIVIPLVLAALGGGALIFQMRNNTKAPAAANVPAASESAPKVATPTAVPPEPPIVPAVEPAKQPPPEPKKAPAAPAEETASPTVAAAAPQPAHTDRTPSVEVSKDGKLFLRNPTNKALEVFVDGVAVAIRYDGYAMPSGAHHIRLRETATGTEKSRIIHVTPGKSVRASF